MAAPWPLLAALVEIAGSASCPSPAQVTAELGRLRPAATTAPVEAPARARVLVDAASGGLRLRLLDPAATLLGERTLPAEPSCLAQARAAALVVAIWERELESGVHLGLPPPPTPPAPRGSEIRVAEPPAPTPPAPEAAAPLRGGETRPTLATEIGASGVALLTAGEGISGSSGGGALEAGLGQARRGPGARLFLAGSSRREARFAAGPASWTRIIVGLGGRWRFSPGAWTLDGRVEALLAALLASGEGVPGARSGTAFDPGLGGGLRLGRRLGPALVHVSAGVWGWPRPQQLRVLGAGGTVDLPRVEAVLGLGVALGRF